MKWESIVFISIIILQKVVKQTPSRSWKSRLIGTFCPTFQNGGPCDERL